MTNSIAERDRRVSSWLAQASGDCSRVGCGRWELRLKNSSGAAAFALIEDGWLLLRVPLKNEWDGEDEWKMLLRNASLEGLCKFARDPLDCCRQLQADLPLESGDGLAALQWRIREAFEGFESALRRRPGSRDAADPEGEPPAGIGPPEPGRAAGFADLLKETGWPFVERSPVKFAVDLEVRGGFAQALIEDRAGREISVIAEAAKFDSLSAGQRSALAYFLLASCGVVRMARASIVESETSAAARFEVRLQAPNPAELGHALSALSVALSFCGREAQCFEDPRVAEIYLMAHRGPQIVRNQCRNNNHH